MAVLTAELFRDYFPGSWTGKISRNGEFQREIIFNWPGALGKYSAIGIEQGLMVPPCTGALDDTKQVAIAGWRSDIRRWTHSWHNEFGGYGEVQWTSKEVIDGITVLYGFGHESKQETDDPTNHIVMCEMKDQDHFKYTIRSFRKGLLEIEFIRTRNGEELKTLLEKQAKTKTGFENC